MRLHPLVLIALLGVLVGIAVVGARDGARRADDCRASGRTWIAPRYLVLRRAFVVLSPGECR
jgi:hypothetical protein